MKPAPPITATSSACGKLFRSFRNKLHGVSGHHLAGLHNGCSILAVHRQFVSGRKGRVKSSHTGVHRRTLQVTRRSPSQCAFHLRKEVAEALPYDAAAIPPSVHKGVGTKIRRLLREPERVAAEVRESLPILTHHVHPGVEILASEGEYTLGRTSLANQR